MGIFSNRYETQDKDDEVHVRVKAGRSHDEDRDTTDVIAARRDGSGHDHIVIDDRGETISHTFREE